MSTEEQTLSRALEMARRALAVLEEQAAGFGSLEIPVSLKLQLEDKRAEVDTLQKQVAVFARETSLVRPECPYRGLLSFREQDAAFFFGREIFAQRLTEVVENRALTVIVVGASGSGKSSAVFAGLLPRLRKANTGHTSGIDWRLAQLRPGARPFEALANALLPLLEPQMSRTERLIEVSKLAGALNQGDITLSCVISELLVESGAVAQLLLLIDQFEELYTLCSDPVVRHAFLDCLLDSISSANLHLVFTLRADFLGAALTYRPFADLLDQAEKLILGPMNREELQAAIVRPAERQGMRFEQGLVARILDDVGESPGSLPLLEFALTQLWELQENNLLTHSVYESIGAVEGALLRYADRVYADLSQTEREQARQVFVQLVRPGVGTEDTRRLAIRSELEDVSWSLIQKLADARLVVTDVDPTGREIAEIAHEALIQRWERLRTWLEEAREFRTWQERLRILLYQWEGNGQDVGALLRGLPLTEAEQWLAARNKDLNPAEKAYIEASIDWREQEQRVRQSARRRFTLITMAVAVVFLMLAILTGAGWRSAEQRRKETEMQRLIAENRLARQLAIQAYTLGDTTKLDFIQSTLLALESLSRYPTEQATQVLYHRIALLKLPAAQMEHEVYYLVFDTAGQWLAAGGGTWVRIWDTDTWQELAQVELEGGVTGLALSPDEQWLVSWGWSDMVTVLETDTWETLARLEIESKVRGVGFSADGRWLVVRSEWSYDTVQVFETTTWEQTMQWSDVNDVAISSTGKWGISVNLNQVEIWDESNWKKITHFGGPAQDDLFVDLVFSPDGSMIATGCQDAWTPYGASCVALVWNVNTGSEVIQGGGISPVSAAFSSNGQWVRLGWQTYDTMTGQLSSADENLLHDTGIQWLEPGWQALEGSAHLLNFDETLSFSSEGRVIQASLGGVSPYVASNHAIQTAAFSPDGRWLVTGGNIMQVWEIKSLLATSVIERFERKVAQVSNPIRFLSFSPDGQWGITGSNDGTIIVWEAATWQAVAQIKHGWEANAVAFHPSGVWAVSCGGDGSVLVWEIATGRVIARMAHDWEVNTVAFSADGRQVLAASHDGAARAWETTTGHLITGIWHQAALTPVILSPDGKWLAAALREDPHGIIRIIETLTGREVASMEHEGVVQALAFSPDGKLVVSNSGETMYVWEAATGKELVQTEGTLSASIAFSADGQWFAAGNHVWAVETGAVILSAR